MWMDRDNITLTGARTSGVRPSGPNDGITKRRPARLRTGVQVSFSDDTKGEGKRSVALQMPGAGLNSATDRKASPERSALKPYWGKPTVRNFRGGYGNGGIIRSPLGAMTLLDREAGDLQRAFGN